MSQYLQIQEQRSFSVNKEKDQPRMTFGKDESPIRQKTTYMKNTQSATKKQIKPKKKFNTGLDMPMQQV